MAGNCYYYQRSFLEAVGEIRQMAIEMGMKPCDGNVLKRFFAENPVLKVGTILKDNEGNQYTFLSIDHRSGTGFIKLMNEDGVTWIERCNDLRCFYCRLKSKCLRIVKR